MLDGEELVAEQHVSVAARPPDRCASAFRIHTTEEFWRVHVSDPAHGPRAHEHHGGAR